MRVVTFDPGQDIPIIDALVRGPRDYHRVRLVFDTGAGMTQIDSTVVELLGYSPRDGEERLSVTDATGKSVEGYSIRLKELTLLGARLESPLVGTFDFSHFDNYRIHGLLGWDIIRTLHLEMDGPNGVLKIY